MKKNILVTGSSSGLGFALVKLYLDKGYNVYGISRKKPAIKHKNFHFIQCDLSKTDKIKRKLKSRLKNIKSFNRVYLNAGMLGDIKAMSKLHLNTLREVMDLNVYANKEIIDILKTINVKKIIAISSGASKNGSFGWGAYSLSKSSLNMLINLYAKEMPKTKLFAIAPGVIETQMTDIIRFKIDDKKFTSAKILKEGKIQKPKQAAKRLHKVSKKINKIPSGSFLDVREI